MHIVLYWLQIPLYYLNPFTDTPYCYAQVNDLLFDCFFLRCLPISYYISMPVSLLHNQSPEYTTAWPDRARKKQVQSLHSGQNFTFRWIGTAFSENFQRHTSGRYYFSRHRPWKTHPFFKCPLFEIYNLCREWVLPCVHEWVYQCMCMYVHMRGRKRSAS